MVDLFMTFIGFFSFFFFLFCVCVCARVSVCGCVYACAWDGRGSPSLQDDNFSHSVCCGLTLTVEALAALQSVGGL